MEKILSIDKEAEAIEEDVIDLIKKHVMRLKRDGWSIEDINDILEEVFDNLPFEMDKLFDEV
jgi:hypothetical protein